MRQISEDEVRDVLLASLDAQREIVLHKIVGVSDDDLRRHLVPSETTLLGVVKHLAHVERWWFQDRFLGRDVTYPWTEDNPDADFIIEEGETTEEVLDLYRRACEASREIVVSAALTERGTRGSRSSEPHPTLLWILVHMIEEVSRHNGHLDILREQIDGAAGDHVVQVGLP